MATTTKTKSQSQRFDSFAYSDNDLQEAFESFMTEEPKTTKSPLLNFPTALGLGMLLVGMIGFFELLGITGLDTQQLLAMMSVFGGLSVLIVGSGLFSRKKRDKKSKRKSSKRSFASAPVRESTSFSSKESSDFENYWESQKSGKSSKSSSSFTNTSKEAYALAKSKKLFKSISDKKIAGVCGGLASYLGVSSTFVRLIFIIATIMGYGSPILIYLALALILAKEPIDLQRFRKSHE